MIKHFILLMGISVVLLQANNFREAMKAYKEADFNKAMILFELSLNKDNSITSSYMLGRMYLNGQGTPSDTQKAIRFLTYAFDSGNIPAGCYISEAYMREGKNSSLLAEGLVSGLRKKVPHCKKVFAQYKKYSFPAEFNYN